MWVSIAGCVIAGIALIATSNRYNNTAVAGWLTLLLGPVVCWLASWISYAIGEAADKNSHEECMNELIEKINALEDKLAGISELNQVLMHSNIAENNTNEPIIKSNQASSHTNNMVQIPGRKNCPHCGASNKLTNTHRFACGETLPE